MSRFHLVLALTLAALAGALPGPSRAQTAERGLLEGMASHDGQPVGGALIHATDRVSGQRYTVRSGTDGTFRFIPLLSGDYDLRVEKLGYRPVVLPGVRVPASQVVALDVRLQSTTPPVVAVDTLFLPGGGRLPVPGGGRRFGELETQSVPHFDQTYGELARASSRAGAEGSVEGLPRRLTGLSVDGFTHRSALHPDLRGPVDSDPLLALPFLDGAELLLGPSPRVWPTVPGPVLRMQTTRGTPLPTGKIRALYGTFRETTAPLIDGNDAGRDDIQGGGIFRGTLIRDTVSYGTGVWLRNSELPVRPSFTDASLADALRPLSPPGVDLAAYRVGALREDVGGSAYGRLDWRLGSSSALSVVGAGGVLRGDAKIGRDRPGLLSVDRESLLAGLALSSRISPRVLSETRIGLDASGSDFRKAEGDGARVPTTRLVGSSAVLGTDPRLPGQFQQWTLDLQQRLQLRTGAHLLEAAAGVAISGHSQTYAFGRSGVFTYGDVARMAAGQGEYWETTGGLPSTSFNLHRYSLLLSDLWSPARGLQVEFGMRATLETLPRDELRPVSQWTELTGIDNRSFDDSRTYLNPHVSFLWNVRNRFEWLVHGVVSSVQEGVEPWVVAEALTQTGSVLTRRGFGDLGAWPTEPGTGVAPVIGPRLTLLSEGFQAPRTNRFGLGITRGLTDGMAVHLEATYRETDNLPVREDLNLPLALASDQYGRAVYGILQKAGPLVAPSPGSNRRFDGFDAVYRISSAGSSEYWGLSLGLERRSAGILDFFAEYTLSSTRDNIPGFGGSTVWTGEDLPALVDRNRNPWRHSTSVLDAPHRVALAARLQAQGRVQPSLTVLYRFASGVPFTPGFPAGVDVNGDGSGLNDPAYVDDTLPGMGDLLTRWPCLRPQVGDFADRNSCRLDSRHSLAVRGALGFASGRRFTGGLFAEVIGLLDDRTGPVNTALYVVDPDAPLVRDPAAGTVTLPLSVNPEFGEPINDFTIGPHIRVGIYVSY